MKRIEKVEGESGGCVDMSFSRFESSGVSKSLKSIQGRPLLTANEEVELASKAKKGDLRARNILVERNLLLVAKIAKKYCGSGLPFEELFQAGTLGLIYAVEHFEPGKGYRLSTYAYTSIKGEIFSEIEREKSKISYSKNVRQQVFKLKRLRVSLFKTLGRKPTEDELALKMGVMGDCLKELIEYESWLHIVSLQEWVDWDMKYEDVLEGESGFEDYFVEIMSCRQIVKKACEVLTERERSVVELKFGLNGKDEIDTNDNIAEVLGGTGEGVRQALKRALGKIKGEL